MKLQKIWFSVALLYLFSFTCYAQVKLKMELLSESQEEINIRLTSMNTSSVDSLLFYTPSEESFCATVISVDFIKIGTNEEHSYFPCTEIVDLDHIQIRRTNSVLIPPSGSYSFKLNLKKKDISPYLKKGYYIMKASLYYGYGNFKSSLVSKYPIYRGAISSNEIPVHSK